MKSKQKKIFSYSLCSQHNCYKYYVFLNDFLCFTEHFTCIVKVLFTLLYTQALAALSVKCSTEDRMAWKQSGALKKVG